MKKVSLIPEKLTLRSDFSPYCKSVSASLPYYEREGNGYVHCAKTMTMHYDRKSGKLTHVSVGFWCGNSGFLYPSGAPSSRRGGRLPAEMRLEPSPGRAVCATCEARAIGSGQRGKSKIGDHFVIYRPHGTFSPALARIDRGAAA